MSYLNRKNRLSLLEIEKRAKGVVPGNIFYVDSGTGSSTNPGTTMDLPLATIDQAINKCTASNGDVIYVLPGHAETIAAAAGIDADVIGISVIGLGSGSLKPTITLGTATTADIDIDAANVTFQNLRFVSNINDLAVILDVNDEYFTCIDCDFVSSNTKEVLNFVNIATTKDNFFFKGCKFYQPTDPDGTDGNASTGCFYFVDSEEIFIEDCYFYGQFETSIFHNKTTAAKNVWVRNCFGTQLLAGAEVFTQVANMQGGVLNSTFIVSGADDVTEAKTWGTLSAKFFVDVNSGIGNDGDGGQLAVAGASAAT